MATYRLFPSTNGPSTAVSYNGPFEPGVVFEVTTGGTWFQGYWWWVCATGQPTSPQTFALWQLYQDDAAAIVSGSTVTSGTLTAGQWNFIPLATPLNLSPGGGSNFSHTDAGGPAIFIACTAFTGGFADTNNEFGSGDPYSAGITNGPLTAFSDTTGTLPAPFGTVQGVFAVAASATGGAPMEGSSSANFWMDVQISDAPPDGYSGPYRIWPNFPVIPGKVSNDAGQQTTGTEFWLSEACTLNNIWFWSPPDAGVLPSRCGIFSVATQTEVAGTDNASPSWSGAVGSGWVSCSYADAAVVLPAGKYKTCIYTGGGATFYQEDVDYFSSGPGGNNIVNGPLTCPSTANATSPGNSTYQDGAWAYPDTFDTHDDGENRWIDVEVTPGTVTSSPSPSPSSTPTSTPTQTPPPPTAKSGAFLVFFP